MTKKLLLGALSVLALSSCRKDDEKENTPMVVGVWKPSKEIVISGKNGAVLSSTVSSNCYRRSTFNFKEDNNVISNIYDENISGECVTFGEDSFPYSYNSANKTIILDGEEQDVLNLTDNEFEIVTQYEDMNDDNFDDKIVLVLVK